MKSQSRLVINISHATTPLSLQEILAAAFDFPGWYGKNWEAFEECVRIPEQSSMPDELVIKGWEILSERLPREAKLLREILTDLKTTRPNITISYIPVED